MITTSKAKSYFGYVPKIPFINVETNDSFTFRRCNETNVVHGKIMKAYLLFTLD